jgi:hypothetical protein
MALERSIRTLLRLIKHRQNADVVTLVLASNEQGEYRTSLRIPLTPGRACLLIGWRDIRPDPDLVGIGPLIESLKLILARTGEQAKIRELILEAARLESDLADCKIAERAAGMIASGEAEPGKIQQHVARVLETVEDLLAASERVVHLRAEIAARKRIAAAKAVLQQKQRLTEQEAYAHLQRASRRTRRTIAQIADEILADEELRVRTQQRARSALCYHL